MKFILILLSIVFSVPSFALEVDRLDETKLREVAFGRYWQLLLHYRTGNLWGYRSEADGKEFFFAKTGKTDPLAELKATVAAFESTEIKIGHLKQPPQCAFPERFRYLRKELSLNIRSMACPNYEEWKSRFQPIGATLVFASAYLNNPASMFGHTFLRIDSKPRQGQEKKNDLLDYGVNYSAFTGPDGGLIFAVKGLTGFYDGFFSLMPYFEKVQEYNDSEARDMWEYKLKLNPEQIDRMLNHLWELGTTHFDYYFLSENCGYHLLSVLEVANPDWYLTDKFITHVIPGDTIRVLRLIPDSVTDIKFRPSQYRVLMQKYESLSGDELVAFEKGRENDFVLNGDESARTLETLLEYQKYRLFKDKKGFDDTAKEKQRKILIARAKKGTLPETLPELTADNRADEGNNTGKATPYAGARGHFGDLGDYYGITLRPAFHDIFERDKGYLRFSELTVLKLDFRLYRSQRQFRVHEFLPVDIVSLAPINRMNKSMSWVAGAGVVSAEDFLECVGCTALSAHGGSGFSVGGDNAIAYGLFKVTGQYSGWFKNSFRLGPSLKGGFLVNMADRVKAGLEGEVFYYPFQPAGLDFWGKEQFRVNWAPKENFDLRISVSRFDRRERRPFYDLTGSVGLYF